MYAIVPDIDSPELTGFDKAIWAALCHFAKWLRHKGEPVRTKPGSCFPTVAAIAEQACFSEHVVHNSLKNLQRLGYVRVTARYGKKGERRSSDYTLFAKPWRSWDADDQGGSKDK